MFKFIEKLVYRAEGRIDSGPGKFAAFINHHPFIVAGIMAANGLINAIFGLWPLTFVNIIYIPVVMYSFSVHRYGICNSCLEAPVGSEEEAEKRNWHINFFHWYVERSLVQILGAAAIYMATVICIGMYSAILASLLNSVLWAGVGWLNWLMIMHNRLVPWCKWCNDEDFDDEYEPAPDPSIFGTRG